MAEIGNKNNGFSFGVRHGQSLLISFCMYSLQSTGVGSNIAIIAMTDKKSTANDIIYDWDKQRVGYILSLGFWGSLLVPFIVCPMLNKYGGKPFITLSLAGTAMMQFAMPHFAHLGGWKGMCVGFIMNSFFLGSFYPSMQNLMGKWAPVTERTRMGNIVYSGVNVGFIISLPLSAYISIFSLGWRGIYYFHGCQTLVWCSLWTCFGSNSPSEHKSISIAEKELILSSLEQATDVTPRSTPWREIMTCKPYWALMTVQACALWSFYIITVEIPVFFKNAVGADLQDSGIFSSFGYILAICFGVIASWIADYMLKSKYLNLTQVRKLFTTIGTWCPAALLLLLMYTPIDHVKTIISITTLLTGLDAVGVCGYVTNFVDLSPHYCGSLFSVSSTISTCMYLCAPLLSGYILDDITDIFKWRKVFMVGVGMYFFGNLVFLIYGSGERQQWDRIIEDESKEDKLTEKDTADAEDL